MGGGEDGLETKTVPPDDDAYHTLLVGNEQDHRDAVLRELKKKNINKKRVVRGHRGWVSHAPHTPGTITVEHTRYIPLRLFPMRFDFELQICVFRSQKRMTLLMQSKYAKSDRNFFDLRIR